MSVIAAAAGKARDQITGLVEKIIDITPGGGATQSVTVGCPVIEAEDFWRDARRVSMALADAGEVRFSAPNRYDWLLGGGQNPVRIASRLVSEAGRLRFVADGGSEIAVELRAAPHHLGTEMTLHTRLPVPSLLAGAAAFTLLYRARALIQTGEVPTIAHNPSARPTPR